MKIAKAIEQEARLSDDLIKEGFSHAFKAGELIQEVNLMLNSEEEKLEGWLSENCSGVETGILLHCIKLFNGKTVSVQAIKKIE